MLFTRSEWTTKYSKAHSKSFTGGRGDRKDGVGAAELLKRHVQKGKRKGWSLPLKITLSMRIGACV